VTGSPSPNSPTSTAAPSSSTPGPDNYANIPATDASGARYSNANGLVPPVYPNTVTDETTLKTGDAGARIACGVIRFSFGGAPDQ
jgi:hypothetical protein